MNETRPYILTILLHPQAGAHECKEIESLVRSWAEEKGGAVKDKDTTKEEKYRLAYPIKHTQQAMLATIHFQIPAGGLEDLNAKLRRQKKILRFRVHQRPLRAESKTLKDAPPHPSAPVEKAAEKPPKEQKAPIKDLDEKIEEILEEEIL